MSLMNRFVRLNTLTDDGEEDGTSIIRIDGIERIDISGRDQKKVEIFHKNISKLK